MIGDKDALVEFVRQVGGLELEPWQEEVLRRPHPEDRLTVADVEREYGVREGTLRVWQHRGRLRRVGYTTDRRHAALYRRADVERALCNTDAGG